MSEMGRKRKSANGHKQTFAGPTEWWNPVSRGAEHAHLSKRQVEHRCRR